MDIIFLWSKIWFIYLFVSLIVPNIRNQNVPQNYNFKINDIFAINNNLEFSYKDYFLFNLSVYLNYFFLLLFVSLIILIYEKKILDKNDPKYNEDNENINKAIYMILILITFIIVYYLNKLWNITKNINIQNNEQINDKVIVEHNNNQDNNQVNNQVNEQLSEQVNVKDNDSQDNDNQDNNNQVNNIKGGVINDNIKKDLSLLYNQWSFIYLLLFIMIKVFTFLLNGLNNFFNIDLINIENKHYNLPKFNYW